MGKIIHGGHTRNGLTHPNGPGGGGCSGFYSDQNVLYQLHREKEQMKTATTVMCLQGYSQAAWRPLLLSHERNIAFEINGKCSIVTMLWHPLYVCLAFMQRLCCALKALTVCHILFESDTQCILHYNAFYS